MAQYAPGLFTEQKQNSRQPAPDDPEAVKELDSPAGRGALWLTPSVTLRASAPLAGEPLAERAVLPRSLAAPASKIKIFKLFSNYLLKSSPRSYIMITNKAKAGKETWQKSNNEVVQRIAVLSQRPRGWERQLNLISWNDGEPKYDIRDWSPDGTRMGKGISLSGEELAILKGILEDLEL